MCYFRFKDYLLTVALSTIVLCCDFIRNQGFGGNESLAYKYPDSCTYFYDSLANRSVFLTVNEPPVYPPGEKALHALFTKNLKFSVDQGCDQCDFRVYYTIEKNGTPVFQKFIGSFLTRKDYDLIESQLITIFQRMVVWQPGKCQGENVPVAMSEVIYY